LVFKFIANVKEHINWPVKKARFYDFSLRGNDISYSLTKWKSIQHTSRNMSR